MGLIDPPNTSFPLYRTFHERDSGEDFSCFVGQCTHLATLSSNSPGYSQGRAIDDGYQNSTDFVVSATESLISQLHTEGDEDLSVMKECDYKRLALTRTMTTAAREADKNTETIGTREQEMEHIDAQIASLNKWNRRDFALNSDEFNTAYACDFFFSSHVTMWDIQPNIHFHPQFHCSQSVVSA